MASIAFFTVVYPSSEKYLDAFLCSLENQTLKDFDTFIVNDGIETFDSYKGRCENRIIELRFKGGLSKIREFGIQHIVRSGKYDVVVFGDSDDLFAANRVEKVTELLKKADIAVNDLDLIDADGNIMSKNYLSVRLNNRDEIGADFILDKNLFGLTNTAVRIELLDKVRFEDDLIATDWFLFGSLIEKGCKAVFTNETTSLYRQHDANVVGMRRLTKDGLLKGIKAKTIHYRSMTRVNGKYAELYEKFKWFEDALTSDAELLDASFNRVTAQNKNIKNPLWWEEIRLVEL